MAMAKDDKSKKSSVKKMRMGGMVNKMANGGAVKKMRMGGMVKKDAM